MPASAKKRQKAQKSTTSKKRTASNRLEQEQATKLPSSGFLLTCDPPTKQFIKHLDELKSVDKKFIIQDLDATNLLIKGKARGEIERKVEQWMDENVFSNVERVGENLET
mmetsp:Transcript_21519/g.30142  ORF Transcript_21519/g.30142 Transcript_21519/m.30142 type:complete len:110 (+) Transcript_21519:53-382(+)